MDFRTTALLLIDIQQAYDHPQWGVRNNPYAEKKAQTLLFKFRERGLPIVHVQQVSDDPSSPFYSEQGRNPFKGEVFPLENETIIQTSTHNAFVNTSLETHLRNQGIDALILCGLTLNHSISTTIRMAKGLGFACGVVADACATFEQVGFNGKYYEADLLHEISLVNLHETFATIIDTNDVLVAIDPTF